MSRPFIPVPNTVSCELIYNSYAWVWENAIHVQGAAPFTDAQLVTLRDTLINWFSTNYKYDMVNTAQLTRIKLRALDSNTAPMLDYTLPSPIVGAIAGQIVPLNVAFCLKLSTGLSGRSARGRWYHGGLPFADTAVNSITPARANTLVTHLTALMTAIPAANAAWKWVVTSYSHDKAWRTTGVNYPIINVGYVDLYIDSQRRRLAYRGRT